MYYAGRYITIKRRKFQVFLTLRKNQIPKSPRRTLSFEPKWFPSFWLPYLTCLIWESYLINCTFQSHDPGILSLTVHEYFTANDRKGVARGKRKFTLKISSNNENKNATAIVLSQTALSDLNFVLLSSAHLVSGAFRNYTLQV